MTVAKDRPGHVRQHADEASRIAEVRLCSRDEGAVSVEVEPPRATTRESFRPITLMEKLSRAVEENGGPVQEGNDIIRATPR